MQIIRYYQSLENDLAAFNHLNAASLVWLPSHPSSSCSKIHQTDGLGKTLSVITDAMVHETQ